MDSHRCDADQQSADESRRSGALSTAAESHTSEDAYSIVRTRAVAQSTAVRTCEQRSGILSYDCVRQSRALWLGAVDLEPRAAQGDSNAVHASHHTRQSEAKL